MKSIKQFFWMVRLKIFLRLFRESKPRIFFRIELEIRLILSLGKCCWRLILSQSSWTWRKLPMRVSEFDLFKMCHPHQCLLVILETSPSKLVSPRPKMVLTLDRFLAPAPAGIIYKFMRILMWCFKKLSFIEWMFLELIDPVHRR